MNNSTAVSQLPLIDAHIHLDSYTVTQQALLLQEMPAAGVESVVAVSMHLASCQQNYRLAQQFPGRIHTAFGYHPEQELPTEAQLKELFQWMEAHHEAMIAVGEVGLPYYARQEAVEAGTPFHQQPYIDLLEQFIQFAQRHSKPVILHAVYDDAAIACDLLQQYQIERAHFHWYKGDTNTTQRMADLGYFISFTPDIVYEEEIQALAKWYPPAQVMAETDGPWPFEGPFANQLTHPAMTREVVAAWAALQGIDPLEAGSLLYSNTKRFYSL